LPKTTNESGLLRATVIANTELLFLLGFRGAAAGNAAIRRLRICGSRREVPMRIKFHRSIVAALAGVLALSTIAGTPAEAHYRHRGDAAVLGAVLGVFGTIAAVAAADRYRDNYGCYGCYGYYGVSVYAYPPPSFY
jgi:hypothetical protein